jgi:phytoene dehydrogenase-like protein
MTTKSLIIIGAGLAGLATGCYAQMNGYTTKIFEMQEKPGGVCVSWKRKGYILDYAVHNVFGITPDSVNNHMWQELGALHGLNAFSFKEFTQVEDKGKILTIYTNLDKLEEHLKTISPSDKKQIDEFIMATRKFSGYDLFAAMSGGLITKLKMLPLMGSLMKYSKLTLKEFADQFTDPFLQKAFATIQYDIPEVPTVIALIFLATLNNGDGGWPMGGSMALSKNIEQRYLELGGQLYYRSKVKRIIVKDNIAIGVHLEDDSEQYADSTVSAADGHSTIFDMLEGKYVNPTVDAYYKNYPKKQAFGLEVWFGVNQEFPDESHALVLFLDKPIVVEGEQRYKLDLEIFNFDPSLAPTGKTVIKAVFDSNYDYWKQLSPDIQKYLREKQKVVDLIAQTLEKRFPGFKSKVEVTEVVTPVSTEHWTAAHRGCQAWGAPKEHQKEVARNGVSKTLPGLNNFYMVGQWAMGTIGLNTVCLSGRQLIRDLCKQDGKKFQTTTKP